MKIKIKRLNANIKMETMKLLLVSFLCDCLLCLFLFWGCQIEIVEKLSEQIKVRSINGQSQERWFGATIAWSFCNISVVQVGNVDSRTNHHLRDLHQCDRHLQRPSHWDSGRSGTIVGIHDTVYQPIHEDVVDRVGRVGVGCSQTVPAQNGHGNVMVVVKEML